MECPWRRTLASVLLLLSPHSFLCQNVVPSGSLPQQPLVKEPLRECASMNPGPIPQQLNVIPSPNGILPANVPRSQCLAEYQRIPEYTAPAYPQACSSAPQTNVGPLFQSVAFSVPQINNLPQIQGPICNTIPNTRNPQAPPLNIIPTPQIANKPVNTSPITNLSPIQEISPITKFPSVDITKFSNLPVTKGFKSKIAPVSMVSNSQNQILPCSQRPIASAPGSVPNVPLPAGYQNQDTVPLVPNPYSQSFVQSPVSVSCKSIELTPLNYLPTPNVPASVPKQNCVPISQVPIQPVCSNSIPFDYVSKTPVSSNCQLSAPPPVFAANVPQLNNNVCSNPAPVTEDYTPVPINLQINVPSPTIPEPQITIITAYPPAPPVPVPVPVSENSDASFGMYPPYPLPPIIIEGRRSKTRSLLPLILIALIANDGCGGRGGACCCCPCCVSNSDIPIPYPIPIPTSNPIIIRASNSSITASNGTVSG